MANKDVNELDKIRDALWAEIEPLRPPEKPKPKAGRPRMGNRKAMDARFYILGLVVSRKHFHIAWGRQTQLMIAFRSGRKQVCFIAFGDRVWRNYDEWKRFD